MALPLSYVVSETVNLSSPGITRQGFGIPLILSNTGNAWATPERFRTYDISAGLSGVEAEFPSTTVEYAVAAAIAAQPSPPRTIMIGKGANKPTLIRKLSAITAVNSTTYVINVWNNGRLWTASYTSDSSATVAEIVAGLVAQLTGSAWQSTTAYTAGQRVTNDTGKLYECTTAGTSAGSGGPTGTGAAITDGSCVWEYIATPNFTATATDTNTTITCTGNAAGDWFAIEPVASGDASAVSNLMTLTDNTTDPGVSTDLTAILTASARWYALIPLFKSKAILSTAGTGVSAWCNANKRLLVVAVSDTACVNTAASGATDVLAVLLGQGGSYTAAQWHPRDYEWLDASTDGYFLPIAPGGDNWRLKTLTGPTPVNFTETQRTNLEDRRAGYYTTLAQTNLLAGGGYVESTTYGFIDTRRNIDAHTTAEQEDIVNLLIANNKVANTAAGRQLIENVMRSRIQASIDAGIISPDPLDPANAQNPVMLPYVITMPPVSNASSFNATTRTLSGVSERWRLANGINSINVTVNVTN